MKLERLTTNKIKIFLTFDDLSDRGLTAEDIKGNSLKIHRFFHEMIEEACEEIGFEMTGTIGVEIFSLQAQGLIIIVSREEEDQFLNDEDEYLDLEVRVGEHPYTLYSFSTLEDVIQLSHCLKNINIDTGSLYAYEDIYYLLLEEIPVAVFDAVISLAAEYGSASTLTLPRLQEYGKKIIEQKAVGIITTYFSR
ncbi:genetic competence negative regulator [Peribacillus saganii]|uniref:Genetic competence negative regulator n=1 Tax=Peribacillus saganii TaxID=2303992 RepID=A0A372LC95_9BACI|nr:genetic competence negative regulator [Peribacillus saganii]RFU63150.1 genetic competence negative regulator [Peribacillus saganii]